jgi:hypothetical protein
MIAGFESFLDDDRGRLSPSVTGRAVGVGRTLTTLPWRITMPPGCPAEMICRTPVRWSSSANTAVIIPARS